MFLIDSILLAPLKGVIWMGQKLGDMAQKEMTDTGRIKEDLCDCNCSLSWMK
jgi:hypothetical protein